MSYHPLLNELILHETLKYIDSQNLKQLRNVHSTWFTIINQCGVMNHSWLITQKHLKQIHNIDKINFEQNAIVCPHKGCLVISYFENESFIVEFCDVSKTYCYKYSKKVGRTFDSCKQLHHDFRVIPSEFCNDQIDHYLIHISFINCDYFVDYTNLFNLVIYQCSRSQFHKEQITYQDAYLGTSFRGSSVDISSMSFINISKFTKIIHLCQAEIFFFLNKNKRAFFIEQPSPTTITKIINIYGTNDVVSVNLGLESWKIRGVWGICDKYLVVITMDRALFYHRKANCEKAFMFFKKYCSIEVQKVFTLSDNKALILFNWKWCKTMGAYYVNFSEKSVTEFKHQDELIKLSHVVTITQLGDNVFMGLGFYKQFIQVIIDVKKLKVNVFYDFDKFYQVDSLENVKADF